MIYSLGTHAISMAVGDFNGDRYMDLVVANGDSDSLSILIGFGNGTFGTPMTFFTGNTPVSVAVGDFNGDGRLDVTAANFGSRTVTIFLNAC
jgi:hypothetical protein